jgi:hypothetical protein
MSALLALALSITDPEVVALREASDAASAAFGPLRTVDAERDFVLAYTAERGRTAANNAAARVEFAKLVEAAREADKAARSAFVAAAVAYSRKHDLV